MRPRFLLALIMSAALTFAAGCSGGGTEHRAGSTAGSTGALPAPTTTTTTATTTGGTTTAAVDDAYQGKLEDVGYLLFERCGSADLVTRYRDRAKALRRAATDLEGQNPPEAVAAANKKLVRAYHGFADAYAKFADDLVRIGSPIDAKTKAEADKRNA